MAWKLIPIPPLKPWRKTNAYPSGVSTVPLNQEFSVGRKSCLQLPNGEAFVNIVTTSCKLPIRHGHYRYLRKAAQLPILLMCTLLTKSAVRILGSGRNLNFDPIRQATVRIEVASQDACIYRPNMSSASTDLISVHSRGTRTLSCIFAVAVLLAGCASIPQSSVPTKESALAPEDLDPVTKVFPVTPAMSIVWQAAQVEPATATEPRATKEPVINLWGRIRSGFGIPNIENVLVRDSVKWYASRPEYLKRMTARSQKYLYYVVEELERRKMPTELALLPFVESAFNPSAVSSAKAAGMWQFIPSTGKDFDLKQNAFRDDRRDVLASTRAALDYLQKLHRMFGDWHLALAAYNWGEGSVSRSIARNQRAGLPTGYTDINMPMETRSYVPKLLAVKSIVANPEAFGVQLLEIDNHPYFQSVTISRDMDLAVAARLAGISLDEFKALNPSANHPVILAAGMSKVLLPWNNAALFQRQLAAHHGLQLANWTAWVVPTTMRPAAAAKKVGMTEADLRRTNSIPLGKSVKAGSTLIVKRKSTVRADVPGSVADTAQLILVKTPQPVVRRNVKHATKSSTRKPSTPIPKRGYLTRV